MKISLICDNRVADNKGGYLSHVDDVIDVDNLNDLGQVLCNFHFAPGVFNENIKRQSNLQSIELLCFDFDIGSHTSKKVHEQLLSVSHLIVGSKNHNKDKGDGRGIIERFHVFIPLNKAISDVEQYKWISKRFATLKSWAVDLGCLEPARYFYKHSAVLYCWESQNKIDVKAFEKMRELQARIDKTKREYFSKQVTGDAVEAFKRTRYFSMLCNELVGGVGRYHMRCQIAGAMKACGLDDNQASDLFNQYNGFGGKFDEGTLRRLV